ncbi:MAG: methyltransferase domain-containing protein [Myxococcales bacterium]|nr:methyltransferase domain-containing protein [Myxococcales bacterium]
MVDSASAPTEGHVIHWAGYYDRLMLLLTVGQESGFRRRTIDAAGIRSGQRVLDVGCGTGTLALAAAEAVGSRGEVIGIDPSAEMIARARAKAATRGLPARFELAAAERLPFDDGKFDVALGSLMFHHLPQPLQRAALLELQRVLAPGGQLVLVDFVGRGPWLHRLLGRLLHRREGHGAHGGHDSHDSHGGHGHHGGLGHAAHLARELGYQDVLVTPFRPRFLECLTARTPGG